MQNTSKIKDFNFLSTILNSIATHILPELTIAVQSNNKVFAAMILDKSTLEPVCSGTNQEIINPLFHGEISCLNNFWENNLDKNIKPEQCYFVSTHEPCSLCLSAITWSGFDNIFYLFDFEDTKDHFNIPHDIKILEEVFSCKDGKYNKKNAFWTSYHIKELIQACSNDDQQQLNEQIQRIENQFNDLSQIYQQNKSKSRIPLK